MLTKTASFLDQLLMKAPCHPQLCSSMNEPVNTLMVCQFLTVFPTQDLMLTTVKGEKYE